METVIRSDVDSRLRHSGDGGRAVAFCRRRAVWSAVPCGGDVYSITCFEVGVGTGRFFCFLQNLFSELGQYFFLPGSGPSLLDAKALEFFY